ncbi:MAG: sugar phosphate isomerase/epimerase [Clostridia bacterium]|nr:sugar phosphate isomerase/epimerase [Clostridia bacterium]
MKKAISIWSFKDKTVKQAMDLAKHAGYDGIELSLNEKGEMCLESTVEELLDIRTYAEELQLKIHSVASGLYWSYSFTSNDENEREKAIEIAITQIKMADILGAEAVLIVPGAVGVDFIDGREAIRYDIAYDRALQAFKRLKSAAEEHKIFIGIENVWNKFLTSPLEMRDFIDKVNSPFVGAYFDVGNVLFNGYPEHWIEILGKRIKKVHFKDYRKAAGGLHGFVDLLSGDVNWPEVMKSFKMIGYDGWVTAEMLPPYTYHSEQIIENTYGALCSILKEEE